MCGTVYGDMHLKDLLRSIARVGCCIPVPNFCLVVHGLRCWKKHYNGLIFQSIYLDLSSNNMHVLFCICYRFWPWCWSSLWLYVLICLGLYLLQVLAVVLIPRMTVCSYMSGSVSVTGFGRGVDPAYDCMFLYVWVCICYRFWSWCWSRTWLYTLLVLTMSWSVTGVSGGVNPAGAHQGLHHLWHPLHLLVHQPPRWRHPILLQDSARNHSTAGK